LGGISEEGSESGNLSSGGYIITAGMDRKIRYWDLTSPDQCAIVSGLELEEEKPAYSIQNDSSSPTIYRERSAPSQSKRLPQVASSKPLRTSLISAHQSHILKGHQDLISGLSIIDLPFRCLVATGRDGVIKVFE